MQIIYLALIHLLFIIMYFFKIWCDIGFFDFYPRKWQPSVVSGAIWVLGYNAFDLPLFFPAALQMEQVDISRQLDCIVWENSVV